MKKAIMGSLVVVSVIAGYMLINPANVARDEPTVKTVSSPAQEALNLPALSLSDESTTTTLTLESMREQMSILLTQPANSERSFSINELFKQITPENWLGVVDAFDEQMKLGKSPFHEWCRFLSFVGERIGKDAILYFYNSEGSTRRSKQYALEYPLHTWAVSQPKEALYWLENECPPENRYMALAGVMGGIARGEPDRAMELFYQLPVEKRSLYAVSLINNMLQGNGVARIEELFSGMIDRAANNGELESKYMSNLFTKLAERKFSHLRKTGHNVQDEAVWLGNHIGQPYVDRKVVYETVRKFTEQDYKAAFEWVNANHAKHPDQVRGYDTVVKKWTEAEGVNAVGEWLNDNMDHPQYNKITRSHVKNLIKEGEIQAALDWVNSITDEEIKAAQLKRLAGEKE